jgi:copper oxidase (laccase) domain-containing protein
MVAPFETPTARVPKAAGFNCPSCGAAIALQATRGGVRGERLDFDPLCTVGDPMHFSYRRGGARSGRMSCVIGLS